MRKDLQRLLRRMAILVVLGAGLMVATSTLPMNTAIAADYCQFCEPFYNNCQQWCYQNYSDCFWNSPPGTDCQGEWFVCDTSCESSRVFCEQNCASGGSGGGSGGGMFKSQCAVACYAARSTCIGNHGIPDAEDCMNSGDNYHSCCTLGFYDCMTGCP